MLFSFFSGQGEVDGPIAAETGSAAMLYIYRYQFGPREGAWIFVRVSPNPVPFGGERFWEWYGRAVEFEVLGPGAHIRVHACAYLCCVSFGDNAWSVKFNL